MCQFTLRAEKVMIFKTRHAITVAITIASLPLQILVDGKLFSNAGPLVIYLEIGQYENLTTWNAPVSWMNISQCLCVSGRSLSVIAKSVWSLSECLAFTLNPSYLPHTHTQIQKTLHEIGRGTKIFRPVTGWSQRRQYNSLDGAHGERNWGSVELSKIPSVNITFEP